MISYPWNLITSCKTLKLIPSSQPNVRWPMISSLNKACAYFLFIRTGKKLLGLCNSETACLCLCCDRWDKVGWSRAARFPLDKVVVRCSRASAVQCGGPSDLTGSEHGVVFSPRRSSYRFPLRGNENETSRDSPPCSLDAGKPVH